MDWQLAMTWIAIGLAVGYVGRLGWRIVRGGKGSCGGCTCAKPVQATAPALIPIDQLVVRQAK